MTRVQSKILCVRLTPYMRDVVEAFAQRNGIENKAGRPNFSGAVRTMLEIAVSDGSQEEMYRIAYANARADLLQGVSAKHGKLMEELAKI